MASVTAGITCTFGTAAASTVALGEITELKWLQGGSLPQGRGGSGAGTAATISTTSTGPWSMDIGLIEVSYLRATAANTVSMWGRKGTLAVGGTARDSRNTAQIVTVNLTTKVICQTLDLSAKVNDVWRYKGTFKIVQE